MPGTLLCGPAGAGKTVRVLDEIRALLAVRDQVPARFLVVVPTYSQAEHLKRRLLRHTARGALLDRGIATFEQLAERRTGIRLSTLAAPAVRDALLAAAFEEVAPPELAKAARFPGLRRAALRFLDEVKALEAAPGADPLAVAAERISAASPRFGVERAAKVAGLLAVLANYERRVALAGLRDHGDLLRELLAHLRSGEAHPLTLFALDGFTDLTDVQEKIVVLLARTAERTLATLMCDPVAHGGGGGDGVVGAGVLGGGAAGTPVVAPFDATNWLRSRLSSEGTMGDEGGAGLTAETLRPGARFAVPLALLERRLAGEDVPPFDPGLAVRFLAGADAEDEADRVARTVLGFTCEGIERSQILVVVRRLDSDTALRVLDALARHGVPARRMGRRPLAVIPTARAALRVLRLVGGAGEPGDALAAIRAGSARDVSDADGDVLVLRARDRGAATLADVAALAAGSGDGKTPATPVGPAPPAVPALATVAAWCALVRELSPEAVPAPPHQVADQLVSALKPLLRFSFEGAIAVADEARAAEDAAALRALLDVVRDVVHALRAAGTPLVTPAELVARIATVADSARVAVPDLRDDAVNVVGAEEARQWEARAAVVCGLRLGEWPGNAREDLFLSDLERAEVERQGGLALPQRVDEALRRERLLFYFAATRARERVVFTAAVADSKGDPTLLSPFLEDAMSILPVAMRRLDGHQRSPGDLRPADGEVLHAQDLERLALAALTERFAPGTDSERRPHAGYALLPHLMTANDGVICEAARWFTMPAAALAEGSAARIRLGAARARSATSLQAFAQCHYKHFASSTLQLRELPPSTDDGIDALTAGQVAHGVLQDVFGRRPLDLERAESVFEQVWKDMASRFAPSLKTASIRANLRRAVLSWIAREVDAPLVAGFMPTYMEWGFGPRGDAPVVLHSDLGDVALNGAVDRIDVADDGRAVVLDWKWSNSSRFTGVESEIEEGADLQLPMYAIAVSRGLSLRVVAVGYVTLRDGKTRWLPIPANAPRETIPARRKLPEGWGEGDGSVAMMNAEAAVLRLDREIRAGDIEVLPRDEDQCAFCSYADLCRYDGERRRGSAS